VPPFAVGVSGPRGGGGVAVDLVLGGHRRLAAFSVAGVGSVVTEEVAGTQIGGAFAIAGRVDGAQIGGAFTVARELHGVQIGGALSTAGAVHGAQIAGAASIAGSVDGAQIGGAVAASSGAVRGVQVAGAVALAHQVKGAQIAGSVAVSAGLVNTQLAGALAAAGGDVDTQIAGALNVAGGRVHGVQIAPFNIARGVDGVQIGVVNVAGSGEGVSIGLLNLVRGGRTELEATYDNRDVGALVLRHGSKRWHNVYGVAARAERDLMNDDLSDEDVWMYGLGLGPSWRRGATTIDVEAMAWHVVYGQDFGDDLDLLAQLRVVLGHPVGPAHVVVGGALNTYVTTDEQRESAFSPRVLPGTAPPMSTADDVRVELWPSVFVGVRI
jgi:hypothetical protein